MPYALTAENRLPILLGNLDLILDRCGVAEFRLLGKSDELFDVIPFPFEKRSVIRNGIISAVRRRNTADNCKLAASRVLLLSTGNCKIINLSEENILWGFKI